MSTTFKRVKSVWTEKKTREIYAQRQMGIYHADHTREETVWAKNNMRPDDVALTILHSIGCFSTLNKPDFLTQLKEWKKLQCVALEKNVRTVKLLDGTTMYMFIIQFKELDDNPMICPLAVSNGLLVSGYAYLCKKKSTCDLVIQYLK